MTRKAFLNLKIHVESVYYKFQPCLIDTKLSTAFLFKIFGVVLICCSQVLPSPSEFFPCLHSPLPHDEYLNERADRLYAGSCMSIPKQDVQILWLACILAILVENSSADQLCC